MRPLELNFASRPFKNDTLPWLGAILGAVALVGVSVWNVRTYQDHKTWVADLEQQYADRDSELEALRQREIQAQREIEAFDRPVLAIRADKANEVIRWKGFSWTRLFNHMEEVLPNDVQMTSIRPLFRPEDPSQRGNRGEVQLLGRVPVTVEGTAKNLQAFFELERNLYGHPHFDQVEPERTDTEKQSGVTSFSLRFLYDSRVLEGDGAPRAEERVVEEAAAPGAETATLVEPEATPAEPGVAAAAPAPAAVETAPPAAPEATATLGTEGEPASPAPTVRSFGDPGEATDAAGSTAAPPPPPRNPKGPRRGGARRTAGEGG